ncbi:MAG: zinc-ribbon domain-containing protein [Nitrososphaera sp.]|uniref:zinc-ribbon domain-containing protein n=1 Tax=Nitrososphaera sp. TaxID=1971748 RepID=UPI0031728DCC
MMAEDMAEKKLRGSGGFAIARVTDDEQKMANLGGPELFLAGIGRLDEDRFTKYFCNKCEKEYEGAPALKYENPNEDLGEGVTLVEKGEYKCKTCSATIAQYRKFEAPGQQAPAKAQPKAAEKLAPAQSTVPTAEGFVAIDQLVGMSAYDSEAMLVGKVEKIGLHRVGGNAQISLKIASESGTKDVDWNGISKIGDIILLSSAGKAVAAKCASCGYQNEAGALFCEECGSKL